MKRTESNRRLLKDLRRRPILLLRDKSGEYRQCRFLEWKATKGENQGIIRREQIRQTSFKTKAAASN